VLGRLSAVVLALGIVLIIIGGAIYTSNRPLTSEDSYVPIARDAHNFPENWRRGNSRDTATTIMIAGVVVSFIGIGGIFTIKKGKYSSKISSYT
jgi:hypothetical protein